MLDVEGFILVGGRSSRMGSDKSQLLLGGQTVVERISAELSVVTQRVRLVGGNTTVGETRTNVCDIQQEWGPLGGIHAALSAASAEWCIIVACDLPFVTGELFQRLLQIGIGLQDTLDAIVPLQSDNRPQPLCAIYRRVNCLTPAAELIQLGEHTPRALLDRVNTRYVAFSEVSDLNNAEYFFFNVNTPENYARALEMNSSRGD